MDLTLDKARLNRWARLLRRYLIEHQQVTIKHTNAISAIAAMLDQPTVHHLTHRLREEDDRARPARTSTTRPPAQSPADGRCLHFVTWTWVEEPQAFMTLAWLTEAEVADLTDALNKIAAATGVIRDIAIYDRSFHEQAAWHGNLAGLVEDELKDALGPWHEVEDDAGKMIGSYFDKYVREPVAPKRTLTDAADRDASGKPATPDLSGLSNDALVKELRRRGCMACVFEPSDVAPRISRHPGVRFADLSPEADPEAMARAQDWLFDNEDKIEEALTSYGNAEVDSLLEDQDEIPELPKIADEVHASGVSGMTTTIAELCENQPHLADGIYRVVSDCDQVSLIERVGEVWQLAERRLPEWAPPRVGELVRFDQAPDAHIVIEQVPSLQVYYVDDVYTIVDQYGETHHVEADDDSWVVLADTRHLD